MRKAKNGIGPPSLPNSGAHSAVFLSYRSGMKASVPGKAAARQEWPVQRQTDRQTAVASGSFTDSEGVGEPMQEVHGSRLWLNGKAQGLGILESCCQSQQAILGSQKDSII